MIPLTDLTPGGVSVVPPGAEETNIIQFVLGVFRTNKVVALVCSTAAFILSGGLVNWIVT